MSKEALEAPLFVGLKRWERLADLLAECGYKRPQIGDDWPSILDDLTNALERLKRTQDDKR